MMSFIFQVGCKILSFLKIYLKSASFTWMFCEGFFLHRLMSDAFSPPRSLLPFYVAGWSKCYPQGNKYSIVIFINFILISFTNALYDNKWCSYNVFKEAKI